MVRAQQEGGKMTMLMRAAMLSDELEEEADGYSTAPISALGALSSLANPGGRSVAAVPRPANRHRQKYDCRRIRGAAAEADPGAHLGAGASPGPRPATGRDAQTGRS